MMKVALCCILLVGLNSVFSSENCSKAQINKAYERCANWSPAGTRTYIRGSCKNSSTGEAIYKCQLRDGSSVVALIK